MKINQINPKVFEAIEYPMADKSEWYSDADYERRGGKIIFMSPDQYLRKVRPLQIDDVSRDNIDDLKNHMGIGRKLDPVKLYADGKEDGRHRAHAAKEMGIKKIPVIIFNNQVTEANLERDYAMHDAAKIALNNIKAFLSKKENIDSSLLTSGDTMILLGKFFGFPDVAVMFAPNDEKNKNNSYAYFAPSLHGSTLRGLGINGIIYLKSLVKPYPEMSEEDKHNLHNFVFRGDLGSVFVHEFIHYLDNKRHKQGQLKVKASTGSTDYFNSPHEFNAYYIQGLSDFFEYYPIFKKLMDDTEEFKELFPTYNSFISYAAKTEVWHKEFYAALSEKYKKKFLKRLVLVWQDFYSGKVKEYNTLAKYEKHLENQARKDLA